MFAINRRVICLFLAILLMAGFLPSVFAADDINLGALTSDQLKMLLEPSLLVPSDPIKTGDTGDVSVILNRSSIISGMLTNVKITLKIPDNMFVDPNSYRVYYGVKEAEVNYSDTEKELSFVIPEVKFEESAGTGGAGFFLPLEFKAGFENEVTPDGATGEIEVIEIACDQLTTSAEPYPDGTITGTMTAEADLSWTYKGVTVSPSSKLLAKDYNDANISYNPPLTYTLSLNNDGYDTNGNAKFGTLLTKQINISATLRFPAAISWVDVDISLGGNIGAGVPSSDGKFLEYPVTWEIADASLLKGEIKPDIKINVVKIADGTLSPDAVYSGAITLEFDKAGASSFATTEITPGGTDETAAFNVAGPLSAVHTIGKGAGSDPDINDIEDVKVTKELLVPAKGKFGPDAEPVEFRLGFDLSSLPDGAELDDFTLMDFAKGYGPAGYEEYGFDPELLTPIAFVRGAYEPARDYEIRITTLNDKTVETSTISISAAGSVASRSYDLTGKVVKIEWLFGTVTKDFAVRVMTNPLPPEIKFKTTAQPKNTLMTNWDAITFKYGGIPHAKLASAEVLYETKPGLVIDPTLPTIGIRKFPGESSYPAEYVKIFKSGAEPDATTVPVTIIAKNLNLSSKIVEKSVIVDAFAPLHENTAEGKTVTISNIKVKKSNGISLPATLDVSMYSYNEVNSENFRSMIFTMNEPLGPGQYFEITYDVTFSKEFLKQADGRAYIASVNYAGFYPQNAAGEFVPFNSIVPEWGSAVWHEDHSKDSYKFESEFYYLDKVFTDLSVGAPDEMVVCRIPFTFYYSSGSMTVSKWHMDKDGKKTEDPVMVGNNTWFKVSIQNTGTEDFTCYGILDILPPGATYVDNSVKDVSGAAVSGEPKKTKINNTGIGTPDQQRLEFLFDAPVTLKHMESISLMYEVKIASDLGQDSNIGYYFPDGTMLGRDDLQNNVGFIVDATAGSFATRMMPGDSQWEVWTDGATADVLKNPSTPASVALQIASAPIRYQRNVLTLGITKEVIDPKTNNPYSASDAMEVLGGDSVKWRITVANESGSVIDLTTGEYAVTDVLPEGLYYKVGSAEVDGTAVEPTILNEGSATNPIVLVWEGLRTLEKGKTDGDSLVITFTTTTKAEDEMTGIVVNPAYLSVSDSYERDDIGTPLKDRGKILDDSDFAETGIDKVSGKDIEYVLKAAEEIELLLRIGARANKIVIQGSNKSERSDTTITVAKGSAVTYQYVLSNRGSEPYANIQIMDLFPATGDAGVHLDAVARNSVWAVNKLLKDAGGKVVTVNHIKASGAKVDITDKATIMLRAAAGAFVPVTTAKDWPAEVVNPGWVELSLADVDNKLYDAMYIAIDSGFRLSVKETVEVEWNMQVPADAPTGAAWNSAAFALNEVNNGNVIGKLWVSEPPRVGIAIVTDSTTPTTTRGTTGGTGSTTSTTSTVATSGTTDTDIITESTPPLTGETFGTEDITGDTPPLTKSTIDNSGGFGSGALGFLGFAFVAAGLLVGTRGRRFGKKRGGKEVK